MCARVLGLISQNSVPFVFSVAIILNDDVQFSEGIMLSCLWHFVQTICSVSLEHFLLLPRIRSIYPLGLSWDINSSRNPPQIHSLPDSGLCHDALSSLPSMAFTTLHCDFQVYFIYLSAHTMYSFRVWSVHPQCLLWWLTNCLGSTNIC